MKALSVRQPWAFAIMHAGKAIENRRWRPLAVGSRIAIHASATPATQADCDRVTADISGLAPLALAHGAIVGTVTLDGAHQGDRCPRDVACSRWGDPDAPWHWVLAYPVPLAVPIPARGALGLWQVPADIAAQLERTEASNDAVWKAVSW